MLPFTSILIYGQIPLDRSQNAMDDTTAAGANRFANHLRRVRLRHLEVLLAVAQHGSLSATARAVGVSQPAVSQWIAEVECAVGVPLFVRGRQLRPTPHLETVLRHARRMVADSNQMALELQAISDGLGDRVRVGTMLAASAGLLPKALLRLRASGGPLLGVSVVEDIAQGLWERFERRELDLIVGRLDERVHAPNVSSEPLYDDPHCIVAGPTHPLLATHATWKRAAEHPWILPPAGTRLRTAIDATFVDQGLPPPTPWVESVSSTLNQWLMCETDCLSVLSGGAARRYAGQKLMRVLNLRLKYDVGPIGMAWDAHEPCPALQRLLQALRESV